MLISFLVFGVLTSVSSPLFPFLRIPVIQEMMMQNSISLLQLVSFKMIVLFVSSIYMVHLLVRLPNRNVLA